MDESLNLVIVEDNPADAELLLRQLRRAGFIPNSVRVDQESALVSALREPVDIVLSDFEMPQFNGLRALEVVRQHAPETPFILVSGTMGEEIAVEAMRRGASDYLLKDRLARLGQAITAALTQSRARHERDALESAMADAEARFRQLFENATEGIFQMDRHCGLMLANPALSRILGYSSPDEMLKRVSDFAGHLCADPEERATTLERLKAQGSLTDHAVRGARKDQQPIWLSMNARIINIGTEREYIEGSLADITDKKILESQLLRAQRLESVGRLAGGIAHDINNILVPVLMGAGMLRPQLEDPEQQSLIDTIEASARRGAAIVKQLLQFSRGAAGAQVPVQPQSLVKDMCDIMRETFPKNISVRTRIHPDQRPIRGDPTQLHQILMNLCVNARDAMPEGGELEIVVEPMQAGASTPVSAGARPKPGRYVAISVRDTGAGILPENMESIFDPFFTTKELGHGTGLGLSTVLGITKSHAGFIQIESEVHRGTTFTICLPAIAPTQEAPQPQEPPAPAIGRSELVLIVDDEAPIRNVVSRVLKNAGYRFIEAHDGAEGVSRFVENMHEIKLVITDVMMPHMDGVGLLRAIRALDPKVPVVATSGAGGPQKMDTLRALGVSGLLHKPFTKDELLGEVARHMRGSRQHAV
ncbi:MAG: response regulator [Opitutaceae bacterium]